MKDEAEAVGRLKASRQKKADIENHFGFYPYSVLRLKNPKINIKDLFIYQHETNTTSSTDLHDGKIKEFKTPKGVGRGKASLTIMPPQLVDFFIKFYSAPNEVYFDPFAGQGVQLQVANIRGLDYIGYDICEPFVRYIKSFLPKLPNKKNKAEIYHKDSKKIEDVADNSVDFCFTSPPYWDIEFYDDDPEQLGIGKTYEQFIEGMEEVARELLRVFKDGGYCVVNINDFTKDGRFYCYHADIIKAFEKAGWRTHDIWIIDSLIVGISRMYSTPKILKKRAPKVHEYAITFIK